LVGAVFAGLAAISMVEVVAVTSLSFPAKRRSLDRVSLKEKYIVDGGTILLKYLTMRLGRSDFSIP
jgi:hypothetical protein